MQNLNSPELMTNLSGVQALDTGSKIGIQKPNSQEDLRRSIRCPKTSTLDQRTEGSAFCPWHPLLYAGFPTPPADPAFNLNRRPPLDRRPPPPNGASKGSGRVYFSRNSTPSANCIWRAGWVARCEELDFGVHLGAPPIGSCLPQEAAKNFGRSGPIRVRLHGPARATLT